VWSYGAIVMLPILPGHQYANISGISNSGQVVGNHVGSGQGHPSGFSWTSNGGTVSLIPLGTDFWNSTAHSVNSAGIVVGRSDYSGSWIPTRWTGGVAEAFLASQQGLPEAFDINEAGCIVGRVVNGSAYEAYFWSESQGSQLLGRYPGYEFIDKALVNNRNEVAGVSRHYDQGGGGSSYKCWIWRGRAGMVDIGTYLQASARNWKLRQIYDMNDAGQIVGTAIAPDGNSHGIRLDPIF
jgi:hypothetical protein